MNNEILRIIEQMNETWEGEPWFGRSVKKLLSEINEEIAFQKPSGQHSIVELLWHMVTWKEFVISRLQETEAKALDEFEAKDWRELDHSDFSLWKKGMNEFSRLHKELISMVQMQNDEILDLKVKERNYNFRQLLNGIIQHDIYHVGQIAYLKKLLTN
jgi:uncharacterized damage-inducible protein DinB